MKKQIINAILLSVAFFLLWQSFTAQKTPNPEQAIPVNQELTVEASKNSFVMGRETRPMLIKISNDTQKVISILYPCQSEIMFDITESSVNQPDEFKACPENGNKTSDLAPSQSISFDLLPFSYSVFPKAGNYNISMFWKYQDSPEIKKSMITWDLKEPSFLIKAWRIIVYRPIYNSLVVLAYYLPNQSVGLAIIILTIIIRTILLLPTNKAMKSQKALQEVQPRLKAIQEKYKGNQAKIAEETVKIWKEYKINPMGSCLPLLLQAPIMIGVFYAVQSGFTFNHEYLIYDFLTHIDILKLKTNFLGILELTERNRFWLPLIVGILQFVQVKLTTIKNNKQNLPVKKENKVKDFDMQDNMQVMQKSMLYVLPIMIAFFSASFPAGIALYWACSTAYGIVQQIFINKKSK
ncbi:MAG: hypothetical protein UR28_C0042G0020 [Candidatus Peregrinibacteria bacterium GW2011_GWF2_33_10]|nr:MAG: hypothetical protein UR28_C0042G0020 [Candidatus Peregrinibacteria bacterium GW2011_GWF2_33_10]OGJ45679.1 MAG: hypothetical protein A2263_01825 [Candidatus Peregrinibacteria bacterium RIFOXYA2_FULL_33_21]OGJ46510.1 MAG: hypothetical protein A2272_02475 [Candidatus Peregrinibacteria bacterium RIFOXYA12_FULL_33_12]OGJ51254.1 MAG: hypothetical protein A2307_00255 [Candidatus Peregrinibacteria bacterium RIFOXYB2_FULL_33_20]